MKQYTSIALTCAAALALSACGSIQSMTAQSAASAPPPMTGSAILFSATASAPASPAEAGITYQLDIFRQEEQTAAPDGAVLAHYRCALPELRALRADGTVIAQPENEAERRALEITSAFCEEFQRWAADTNFREVGELAQDAYEQAGADGFAWDSTHYTAELQCAAYQTERLVSIAGTYVVDTGGAHPNTILLAWNFDLTDGAFFDPSSLALDSQEFEDVVTEALCDQAVERAAAQGIKPEELYWENYRDILAQWPSYAVSFSAEGMAVGFSPYELGCYAIGAQEFTLSRDLLEPYLGEEGRALLGTE